MQALKHRKDLRSRLDHREPPGFNTAKEIMARPFQCFSQSSRLSGSALPLPKSTGMRGIRKTRPVAVDA